MGASWCRRRRLYCCVCVHVRFEPSGDDQLAVVSPNDCENLREFILVFDEDVSRLSEGVLALTKQSVKGVQIKVLGYSRFQRFVAGLVNWGWLYAWLSWCIA